MKTTSKLFIIASLLLSTSCKKVYHVGTVIEKVHVPATSSTGYSTSGHAVFVDTQETFSVTLKDEFGKVRQINVWSDTYYNCNIGDKLSYSTLEFK